jgi:hypothetical protein
MIKKTIRQLKAGERIDARLETRLVAIKYVYSWESTVRSRNSEQVKAIFNQSTFYGESLSLSGLRKIDNTYAPELSADSIMAHYILGQLAPERRRRNSETVVRTLS